MNHDALHLASKTQTDSAVTTLMCWVANAQKSMDSGQLDPLAMGRLGELVLNACKYLADREETLRKTADRARRLAEAEPSIRRLREISARIANKP